MDAFRKIFGGGSADEADQEGTIGEELTRQRVTQGMEMSTPFHNTITPEPGSAYINQDLTPIGVLSSICFRNHAGGIDLQTVICSDIDRLVELCTDINDGKHVPFAWLTKESIDKIKGFSNARSYSA